MTPDILATAAAPVQEPVGEVLNERGEIDYISYVPPVGTRLYTTPPASQYQCKWPTCQNAEYQQMLATQIEQELVTGRPWIGLTASTILNLMPSSIPAEHDGALMEFARDIEAKLKEKNT